MTLAEIKHRILDTFTEVYNVKYVGTLEVKRIEPIGLSYETLTKKERKRRNIRYGFYF